ncbi:hypothetical protein H5T87_11170 [bacterium]|nr:hypothetical protein [bacterium]
MTSNIWIKKSIQIANSCGYLDKLLEIYSVPKEEERPLPSGYDEEKIREAFEIKDVKKLLTTLLSMPKFPIDDPYIPCLRHFPELIDKNPKTVKRIGDALFSLGIETLLNLAKQPKKPSRQMGSSFKKWLNNLGYPYLKEKIFLESADISFLKGSDQKLLEFAKTYLGIKSLDKGVDFIIKINGNYILGEAKFISDFGGSQTNQLKQALEIGKLDGKNFRGVAVLDGIIWFNKLNNTYLKTIKTSGAIALSALLLKEFFDSLK